MRELNFVKIILLFYLFNAVACEKISDGYTELSMESPKICHPHGDKKSTNINTAIIVKPLDPHNFWSIDNNRTCRFVFKTGRHVGLFAVIQNMSFRRDGKECIDYVQFREGGITSKRFCEKFDTVDSRYVLTDSDENEKEDEDENDESSFSKAEFKSPKGELETRIFISGRKLQPGERLDLRIVYTPYRDCNRVKNYSEYHRTDNNMCIWKGYYCDGIKNCALNNCLDETGCDIVSDGTGTKVTVGAVTTMVLLFLLFVMCLWICRKHKKLCWSPDCAGPNMSETNNQPIDLRLRDSSSRSVVPTAPMLDETTTRSLQDKDLPPSYDSLFPEQPVTMAATTTETETAAATNTATATDM